MTEMERSSCGFFAFLGSIPLLLALALAAFAAGCMPAGTDGPGRREPGTCRCQGTGYGDEYLGVYYYVDVTYDSANGRMYLNDALRWVAANMQRSLLAEHQYLAVIVFNLPEHQGEQAFEQAHKIGAVFSMQDVLDNTKSADELVAKVNALDRPFLYEKGKNNRWLIIEEHQREQEQKGTGKPEERASQSSGSDL